MAKGPSFSKVWRNDRTGQILEQGEDIYAAVETEKIRLAALEIGNEDKVVGNAAYAQVLIPLAPEIKHEDLEADKEAQIQK